MTAIAEIREKATLYGWDHREAPGREDVFLRGNNIVYVRYRRDGSVDLGERYSFLTVAHYRDIPWWDRVPSDEQTPNNKKKETVFSWLAAST